MVHKALKLGLGGHFGQLVQNGLSLLGVTAVIEAGGLGVLPQEHPEGRQLIVCLIHGITSDLVCRGGAGFIPHANKLRNHQHLPGQLVVGGAQGNVVQRPVIQHSDPRGERRLGYFHFIPATSRIIRRCTYDIPGKSKA